MAKLWVGVDIGKEHIHITAIDTDGTLLYSRPRVAHRGARPAHDGTARPGPDLQQSARP